MNRNHQNPLSPGQLSTAAKRCREKAQDTPVNFKASNLTTLTAIALVAFVLAAPIGKEGEETPAPNPLEAGILEFNISKQTNEFAPGEVTWDEAFLNTKHWDKLPVGGWHLESKTDTALKFASTEIRPFLGGPARLVRIRTEAGNADQPNNRIKAIEVTWADIGLSFGGAVPFGNLEEMNSREQRKEMKLRERIIEEAATRKEQFIEATETSLKMLEETLTARFGKPEKNRMGNDRKIAVDVLDFKTPNGTTLRLFHDASRVVMLIIYRTEDLEDQGRRLIAEEARTSDRAAWALSNVRKADNGDVSIANIPMHSQGDRGACYYATLSMIYEYWGSTFPLEVLYMKRAEFQDDGVFSTDTLGAAAADTRLNDDRIRCRMRDIMKEIDAGRPIHITRGFRHDRQHLWAVWRDATVADPAFKIPVESRKERESVWTNRDDPGHASIITGYNKEEEILLITESWGQEARNYRVSFDEIESACKEIRTFSPK